MAFPTLCVLCGLSGKQVQNENCLAPIVIYIAMLDVLKKEGVAESDTFSKIKY